jgi:FdhD protein
VTDSVASTIVYRWDGDRGERRHDRLAVEEPCEVRLEDQAVAVIMRTPGHDRELAAGFLFTEGIIGPGDVGTIASCSDPDALNPENIIEVRLAPGRAPRGSWQRNFYAASSCGICGKASIDAIHVASPRIDDDTTFDPATVAGCVERLRESQSAFEETGGLHGAGVFSPAGELLVIREDVGRHNAVDKCIGWAYLNERLPLRGHMLVVSGRSSFEIVQKARVAGIPVIAAVSAASSLAADLAAESNMTLLGFVRGQRLVAYAGERRIRGLSPERSDGR